MEEIMAKDYLFHAESMWHKQDANEQAAIQAYGERFKAFLNAAKTEREFVALAIKELKELGYKEINACPTLKAGDKVYQSIRGKGLAVAVIGKRPSEEGFNLLGSHIDSPRFDAKAHSVQEHDKLAYLATQYYGGVKKYQWTCMPLAIHGVITKADGTVIPVSIGEKEDEPVFYFTDLLPHLGREQMSKTANSFIQAEQLKLLVGSEPSQNPETKEPYRERILEIIAEKYGVTEADLIASELEIVPANKARDVGLDRSMIGSYGQDDKLCSFASFTAIADINECERTSIAFLYDKEEIGSEGNTGAQSRLYELFLMQLVKKTCQAYDSVLYNQIISKSYMISSDVTAAFDPMYPDVFDKANNAYLTEGLCLMKHTGSGGKSSSNDANSEFLRAVINVFEKANLPWQIGTLGKIDAGGGGTIAKFAAKTGMQVVDAGIPVLSMHAPMEICHKLDLYYSYLAYKAFLLNMDLLVGDR